MDDSTTSAVNKTDFRIPLGMSSFGAKERQQFGQNIRLAMACIEGSAEPVNAKAMPSDEAAIALRLKSLSQDITSHHADLLELLVRFDDLQGWKTCGASHCAECHLTEHESYHRHATDSALLMPKDVKSGTSNPPTLTNVTLIIL